MTDAITGVCQFSLDGLAQQEGFSRRKMTIIENGIALERYATAGDRVPAARLQLDPARRYIGNVARFHPVKDQAMLLHAFARVAAAQADVDLLLVGDGISAASSRSWSVTRSRIPGPFPGRPLGCPGDPPGA